MSIFIAVALCPESVATVYACRYIDRNRLVFGFIAFTMTTSTFFNDFFTLTLALWTSLGKGHRPLTHDDLTLTATVITGLKFAIFGAGTFTVVAR